MSAPVYTQAVPVDPGSVPQRKLYTGASMPAVGLGTFGSDHVSPDQVANAVLGAAAVGYRHFDRSSSGASSEKSFGLLQKFGTISTTT
jgi:diketogulonate reductase-like aldo/keto reductase